MMVKLLVQPFPFTVQINNRIRTALIYGLFVFLFLLVFRPFGLHGQQPGSLVLVTFLYGFTCSLILLICFLALPSLFPLLYAESEWTVWKEICHTLLCVLAVTAGNIFLTHLYFHEPFSAALVWQFLWNIFSISILPITFLVLIRQVRLMRTFGRQAAELDRQLPELPIAQPTGPSPMLFDLPLSDFLYAEAADNYTKLFYSGRDKPLIIRSSLKGLEKELAGQTGIYRCHRTYIVNLEQVVHVSGNAQGYKLHLRGQDETIPVSRNLNREIASLVTRPNQVPVSPTGL